MRHSRDARARRDDSDVAGADGARTSISSSESTIDTAATLLEVRRIACYVERARGSSRNLDYPATVPFGAASDRR